MLRVEARTVRVTDETAGVADVAYESARLAEGDWNTETLEALVRERDGDVVALTRAVVAELAYDVSTTDEE